MSLLLPFLSRQEERELYVCSTEKWIQVGRWREDGKGEERQDRLDVLFVFPRHKQAVSFFPWELMSMVYPASMVGTSTTRPAVYRITVNSVICTTIVR